MARMCSICGKQFDFYDEQQDFSLIRDIGYGSKYAGRGLTLNLCCGCFDGLMDKILPKCAGNPISELDVNDKIERSDEQVLDMFCRMEASGGLKFRYQKMWLRLWQGMYVVESAGTCRDPFIKLPRSIKFNYKYGEKEVVCNKSVYRIERRAFANEKRLKGIALTSISEINEEAFADCTELKWLYISKSLYRVGRAAFKGCNSLHTIFYEGTEQEFKKIFVKSLDREVYSPDKGATFEELTVEVEGNESFLNAKVYYNCKLNDKEGDK